MVESFVHHSGMVTGTVRHQARLASAVVENCPFIRERKIVADEVAEAARVASPNIGCGNVVATLAHALTHAPCRHGDRRKPQVEEFYGVGLLARIDQHADIGEAAQGGFQSKGLTGLDGVSNLAKKQSRRLDRASRRIKGRKPSGHFIRIQEAQALHFLGQKLFRKRGLPAPLQPAVR